MWARTSSQPGSRHWRSAFRRNSLVESPKPGSKTTNRMTRESQEQTAIRLKAATLALIGVAVIDSSRQDGDEVVVRVAADLVGGAMAAADNS